VSTSTADEPALPRAPWSPTTLALRLTLLGLLLRPIGVDWVLVSVCLLAVAGLAVPRLMHQASFWWLLAGLAGIRVVGDWPMADNHAYLMGYWLLAIALSRPDDAHDTLARNARLLIGLTFAFASLWKVVLSPDYLDGTFFRVSMATDVRLEWFTRLAAGVDSSTLEALRDHLEAGTALTGAPESDRYRFAATLATWWNILINVALAVVFLGPPRVRIGRNALLILYCAVTYAVATVDGFAWLLISMGVAQTSGRSRTTLAGYLAVFALVLAYRELL
jgi:hypothetical protein